MRTGPDLWLVWLPGRMPSLECAEKAETSWWAEWPDTLKFQRHTWLSWPNGSAWQLDARRRVCMNLAASWNSLMFRWLIFMFLYWKIVLLSLLSFLEIEINKFLRSHVACTCGCACVCTPHFCLAPVVLGDRCKLTVFVETHLPYFSGKYTTFVRVIFL